MAYRKLGRTSSQRKAVLRDLTTDLIINEAPLQLKHVLKKSVKQLKNDHSW